jgi:hypothetical protein
MSFLVLVVDDKPDVELSDTRHVVDGRDVFRETLNRSCDLRSVA